MSNPAAVTLSTMLFPTPAAISSPPSPKDVPAKRKPFCPMVVGIAAGLKNVLEPRPKSRSDASSVRADP